MEGRRKKNTEPLDGLPARADSAMSLKESLPFLRVRPDVETEPVRDIRLRFPLWRCPFFRLDPSPSLPLADDRPLAPRPGPAPHGHRKKGNQIPPGIQHRWQPSMFLLTALQMAYKWRTGLYRADRAFTKNLRFI